MNQEELTNKIYDALTGKYQERDRKTLWQKRRFMPKRSSGDKACFELCYFEDARQLLEAMVLIPEDAGLATVEIHETGGDSLDYTCSAPEYDNRALEAIYAACARKFAEPGKLVDKWSMLVKLDTLTGELPRFKNHKEELIAGIANAELGKSPQETEELLDVFAHQLQKMEFSEDKELVQAYWQMAKQSPNRYLRSLYGWQIMADYLLEVKPEILTEFEYVRRNLSEASLSEILRTIPVNPEAKEIEKKHKRIVPLPEEVWKPILEYVDKAIMENRE